MDKDFIDISDENENLGIGSKNQVKAEIDFMDISFDEFETEIQTNSVPETLEEKSSEASNGSNQSEETPSMVSGGENQPGNNIEQTPENTPLPSEDSGHGETDSSQSSPESSNKQTQDSHNNQKNSSESNNNDASEDENDAENSPGKRNGPNQKKESNKGNNEKTGDTNKNPNDKKPEEPNKKDDDPNKKNEDPNKNQDDKNNVEKKPDDKNNAEKKPDDKNNTEKKPDDKKNDQSAADKKRQEAKDKNDRRKKNNDSKDSNVKKPKGNGNKSGGKSIASRTAGVVANKAANNSETAQNVQKTVNVIMAVKKINPVVIKVSLIIILVLVLIFLFGFMAAAVTNILHPGAKGDIKESYSNYTEADQASLEGMSNLFTASKNADLELAVATVLYPYYTNLHGGNTSALLQALSDEQNKEEVLPGDVVVDASTGAIPESINTRQDDIYLIPFRNPKVLKRLEILLQNMGNKGDNTTFENYVKNTYFMNDGGFTEHYDKTKITGYNGYYNMFEALKNSSDSEKLKQNIISDLYKIKGVFKNYIITDKFCSAVNIPENASSADKLYNNIIQGKTPYVIMKDSVSGDFSQIKAAKSLYGTGTTPMDLERYIMGVVYVEVGPDVVNDESVAKAFMIAAHSLLLGRTQAGRGINGHTGKNFTPDYTSDGKVIFYIRGNTYDQDFCDVYEGCQNGSNYGWDKRDNDAGSGNPKPALSQDGINKLKKWWGEVQNQYVYHSTSDFFGGSYSYSYTNYCKAGSCITVKEILGVNFTDYKELLFEQAYTDKGFSLYDSSVNSLASVSVECTGIASGNVCTISDNEFIYYSQKVGEYSDVTFCGRSDGSTIRKSGCGITSMAMVIANLSDSSVTPLITNEEAKAGGYCGDNISGTSGGYFSNAASKYGLKITQGVKSSSTDLNSAASNIESTLMNGGLAIINVNSTWLGGSYGHYIVIKGIAADKKLIIADPYSDTLATSPHNLEFTALEILTSYVDNGHGWYMFTSNKSSDIANKYCSNTSISGSAGILTNPLYPKDNSKEKWLASLNTNSKTLYYLQSGAYKGAYHGGSDLPVPIGTSVYAMDVGTVYKVQDTCGSYGRHIILKHTVNGKNYYTIYAHLNSIEEKYKKIGTQVAKGELIAKSGNTYHCGSTVAPHLHVGISYESNGSFPQTEGDKSFLIGNFMGTNLNYSIVDSNNLSYYKEKHY